MDLSIWGVKDVASVSPTASKEVLPHNPEARDGPISSDSKKMLPLDPKTRR